MGTSLQKSLWWGILIVATNASAKLRPIPADIFNLQKLNQQQSIEKTPKPLASADFPGWHTVEVDKETFVFGAQSEKGLGFYTYKSGVLHPSFWLPTPGGMTMRPLIEGSRITLGFRDGSIWHYDLKARKLLWQHKLTHFATRQPKIDRGVTVIVTASESAYAFQDGKLKWQHQSSIPIGITIHKSAPPSIINHKLYYGLRSGEIAVLDFKSGAELRRYQGPQSYQRLKDVVGELFVESGSLIYSRSDGVVEAFDLQSHKSKWTLNLPSGVSATLKIGPKIYAGTNSGSLYVIQNGKILGSRNFGGRITMLSQDSGDIILSKNQGEIVRLSNLETIKWLTAVGATIAAPPLFLGNKLFLSTGMTLYGFYR